MISNDSRVQIARLIIDSNEIFPSFGRILRKSSRIVQIQVFLGGSGAVFLPHPPYSPMTPLFLPEFR